MTLLLAEEWDLHQFKPRMLGSIFSQRSLMTHNGEEESELNRQFNADCSITRSVLDNGKVLLHICFHLTFTTLQQEVECIVTTLSALETKAQRGQTTRPRSGTPIGTFWPGLCWETLWHLLLGSGKEINLFSAQEAGVGQRHRFWNLKKKKMCI